jgi:Icc-related predicted phosphoesterase
MKIALGSDLHLEFGAIELHNTEAADVLILSGDILVAKHLNGGKYIDKEHADLDKQHKAKLSDHDKKYGTNEIKKQQEHLVSIVYQQKE